MVKVIYQATHLDCETKLYALCQSGLSIQQCNMIVFTFSCLLCLISTFTSVTPFEQKSREIWLLKSENNEYLLNINSTPTDLDSWYMVIKQNSAYDDEDKEVFTDIYGSTSVTISYNNETNKYSLDGILNNTWIISPLDKTWITESESKNIWSSASECDDCLPILLHTVTLVGTDTVSREYVQKLPENETRLDPSDPGIKALPLPSTIYPEMLVSVDYSLHKKLGGSKSRTRQYVQKHFNSVNSIYATLSHPRIKMHLAGVIVATYPTSLPFLHPGGRYTSAFVANPALDSMGEFFYNRAGLPNYDIVVALTAQDMQWRDGSSSVIGLANQPGACVKTSTATRSVTIVEDKGTYNGVSTMAHEVAHLLDVNHDAQGRASSCSKNYIMSPFENGSTKWSQCSVKQLRSFLNSRRAHCLYNKPRGVSSGVIPIPPTTSRPIVPSTSTTSKPIVPSTSTTYKPIVSSTSTTPKPVFPSRPTTSGPINPQTPPNFRPIYPNTPKTSRPSRPNKPNKPKPPNIFDLKHQIINHFVDKFNNIFKI